MIDAVADASLNYLINNTTQLCFCATQPVDFADANTKKLALKTGVTPTDFTGPVNGDVSGRKLSVKAIVDQAVTASGTSDHLAFLSADTLLYVMEITPKVLTLGDSFTSNAVDVEWQDPEAPA